MFDKNKVFEYLDMLRNSAATNMFGAGPYLEEEFGMNRRQARDYLMEWMKSKNENPHSN